MFERAVEVPLIREHVDMTEFRKPFAPAEDCFFAKAAAQKACARITSSAGGSGNPESNRRESEEAG